MMTSESEASTYNYQIYIESAPYAVFVADAKGKLIEVNKAACEIFGYTKDDLLSMSFTDYLAPECIEYGIDHFKRVQKDGSAFGEYLFLRKTGEKFWASVAATRISKDRFIAFCRDVTQQKVAEGALKKSEEKYRMVVENSQEAIIIVQDEVVKFANAAVGKIIQVPREEIVGMNMGKYIHVEDRAFIAGRFQHRIKGDPVPSNYDFRVVGKNGMVKWVQASTVITTWEGRPATLNFLIDVTERKSAEDALRKCEQFTRLLIDNTLAGMIIIDPRTHTILDANAAAVEMIGVKRDHIIGAVCHKFICPAEKGACPLTDLGLKGDNAERVLVRSNGNLIPIIKTARLITAGEKPYIIESFLDITERKRVEETRKKAHDELETRVSERTEELSVANMQLQKTIEESSQLNAALEDSQKNLRGIFESLDDVYYRADMQGFALNASPSCAKVLGWNPYELIGTNIKQLCADPAELDRLIAVLAEKRIIHDYEVSLKHKDGRLITVSINSHFVIDKNGNNVGIEGTFRDITSRKKMEESISRQATILAILNEIITTANRAENLTKLLDDCLDATLSLLNYSGGGIYLVDTATGLANIITHRHLPMEFIEEIKTIPVNTPPYDTLFVNSKSIITDNYAALAPARAKKFGLSSLASIPLVSRGVVVGALNVACGWRHVIPKEEIAILMSIGQEVGSAIGRILAEEKIRQSEINLQTLFNSVTEMIFVLDMEGKIFRVNEAVHKQLQYTQEELFGMNVLSLHVPERLDDALKILQGMLAGTIDSCPVPLLAKDGKRIDVETKVTRGTWDGREVLIGVSRDITERKTAEVALFQLTDRLALATRAGGVGIWEYNVINNTLTWDDQMFALYGITPELFSGAYEAWQAGLHLDDRERGDKEIQMALRGEKEFDTEFRVLWPDGSTRTIRALAIVQRDSAGKPLRMIGTNWDITAQKTVEEELRASETRYNQLAGQSRTVTWEVDNQGLYTYVSHVSESVWGYRPDELVGRMHYYDLHPESGRETFRSATLAVFEQKEEFRNLDTAIQTKDGRMVWVSTNGIPLLNANGTLQGYRGSDIDITERKQAEAEINRQSLLIKSLLDSIPDIIFFKDLKGVYLGCNPSFVKFVGKSREDIIGKTDYDLFNKDIADFFREHDKRMLELGEPRHNEEWITYPDGRKILIDTLKTPYRGTDGTLIGILGISRDITERKRVEDALKSSEEQLSRVIEGSGVGTWDLQLQTGTMVVNERWAESLGYTLAELAPMSFDKVKDLTNTEDMANSFEVLNRHLRGEPETFEYEARLRHKDDRWVWMMVRGKVVERDAHGHPVRMTGTSLDITDRKLLQEKLQHLSDRLQLATRAANVGIWDWDITTNKLIWDDAMYSLYGIKPDEFKGAYEAWEAALHPDDLARAHDEIQKAIRGESEFNPEFRVVWKDGSVHYIKANSLVQRDNNGKAVRFIGTNYDITDRKLVEIALENLNDILVTLSDDPLKNINTLTALCGVMLRGTCALYNRITGDTIESVGQWNTPPGYVATDKAEGHICTDVAKQSPDKHFTVIQDLRQTHYARSDPNVEKYQLDTYIGSVVQIEGNIHGTLCVLYQRKYEPSKLEQMIISTIAQRIGIEEELYFSQQHMLDLLREREILLKEIHHRVKNNMQVISSLLMLQRKQIPNPETRDLFLESENRVFSIALIHEKLYQAKSLSMIELQPYLVQMGDNMYTSRAIKPDQISLTVTAPDIVLPIDKTIPLSLITNELLTNSLKHAFPDGRKGRISIDINREEDTILYRFSDDGIGFPVDLDFTKTETLGMQLIFGLTAQLFGTITMKRENGTTFEIRFASKP